MKYYIIAGEASGDLHGSNLMKALKKHDSDASFRFWGGDLMQEVGGTLVQHYKSAAFMGFIEVIMNLKTILKNIEYCKKDIQENPPDCVIFIDYPGFNLRLAPFVKLLGIKTIYYISPQLWAWKEGRIKIIKKNIDKMLVILPFEKDWYEARNYLVDYIGHPLLDVLNDRKFEDAAFFKSRNKLNEKDIIALLPGSRKQEISAQLPIMLKMMDRFPNFQFVIAGAPSMDLEFYNSFNNTIKVLFNETYTLLHHAKAALVTSGTATLETALLNTPQVVCYKGSWISYQIGKRLVKNIKFISLVNLIMDKEVVKELIQDTFNIENVETELQKILEFENSNRIKKEYMDLKAVLGSKGASEMAAQKIIEVL